MNQHKYSNTQSQETRKIFREIEDEVERGYSSFKNFQVVDDVPTDHHYLTQEQNVWTNLAYGQAFRERMKEEWSVLEEQIPSSIFVRMFEQRIDLMRVAFLGPPGSDYEHCLFFFDVFFPANYPQVPPMIHYLSGDDPLPGSNPNLLPSIRVGFNTLETWYGRFKQNWCCFNRNTKWKPEEYNVLQLLHAMESLVSHHSAGPAHTGSLKEHKAKILFSACEKMIWVLRKPPIGFEFLVAGHFRRISHPVLLKFKENECHDKIMIDLFKRMFRRFEENGSYCKHHLDFLKAREQQITAGEEADQ